MANRSNEQGVSALIRRNNELELRLQNQFTSLSFEAGQSNDSISSECITKIDVVVDGEVRETREFGFNVIQVFEDVDVADSNAVKLQISSSQCLTSEPARVVLSRIQLE